MFLYFLQVQFVITFSHSVNSMFNGCDFPFWGKLLLSCYMASLFMLFMNFYAHAYANRKRTATHKHNDSDNQHISKSVNGISNGTNNDNSNEMPNWAANGNMSDKKAK